MHLSKPLTAVTNGPICSEQRQGGGDRPESLQACLPSPRLSLTLARKGPQST